MKVLVTGSSGEIGTNLCMRLQTEGHEVFGIDKRKNTWTNRIEHIIMDLSQPFTNFEGGFGDCKIPFKPDVVIHLAANAKVHELVKLPGRAMDNISVTFNVLEYCRVNNIPIVFSSSREVYGDINRFNDESLSTEEHKADHKFTESPYSASKIAGEALIYSYARCYALPYVVLRFSNVYGRFDNDIERMERVIPLFIKKIDSGEPITVFGEDKLLDFTHVDDCVSGIYSAAVRLAHGEVKNETINLAYGQGHSLIDMVKFIEQNLGKRANMTIEKSKVGEVNYYVADLTKARNLLGYNPQTPLPDGIRKCIEWWKSMNHLPSQQQPQITPDSYLDNKPESSEVPVPKSNSAFDLPDKQEGHFN